MKDFLPDLGRITRESRFLRQGKVRNPEEKGERDYRIPNEELSSPAPTISGTSKQTLFENERQRIKRNDPSGGHVKG